MRQICGVSFRLRRYLNKRAALNMYYSYVYSLLSYCIGMWGGALLCTSIGEKLCHVQNKIVHKLISTYQTYQQRRTYLQSFPNSKTEGYL